jgi:hypothetical protein
MRKELDEKLVKKYPKIFADRNEDMRKTAMCWGFSCGDGWYDIIDTLCDCIQNYIDNHNRREENSVEQVVATQVKEKFGGLRFYIRGGDEKISGIISFVELYSTKVCEVCGNRGKIRDDGAWIRTLCDEHKDI